MFVKSIEIENVGGIKSLSLILDSSVNIICGPNGIGKTTILECISHIFSGGGHSDILKRNSDSKQAKITLDVTSENHIKKYEMDFDLFSPGETIFINSFPSEHLHKIISIKTARNFNYLGLESIKKDIYKNDYNIQRSVIEGVKMVDAKNWFVNRFMFSAHEGSLTPENFHNFNIAKESFSLLDNDYVFSKVTPSLDIMIMTPRGEIFYEYLSSGFKSVLTIIFTIIKEIELRYGDNNINADSFDGIILIDEIDLHIHPKWQQRIVDILSNTFPHAQFILTTHSPHVIQIAKPNQVVALSYNDNVLVRIDTINSEYGYQGWTIEEVLRDVMGMDDLRTDIYNKLINEFNNAIVTENYEEALLTFNKLEKILHPQNELKKLLEFQTTAIKYL